MSEVPTGRIQVKQWSDNRIQLPVGEVVDLYTVGFHHREHGGSRSLCFIDSLDPRVASVFLCGSNDNSVSRDVCAVMAASIICQARMPADCMAFSVPTVVGEVSR